MHNETLTAIDKAADNLDLEIVSVIQAGGSLNDCGNLVSSLAQISTLQIAQAMPNLELAVNSTNEKLGLIAKSLLGDGGSNSKKASIANADQAADSLIELTTITRAHAKTGWNLCEGVTEFVTPAGATSVAISVHQGAVGSSNGSGKLNPGHDLNWTSQDGIEAITFHGHNDSTKYLVNWVGGESADVAASGKNLTVGAATPVVSATVEPPISHEVVGTPPVDGLVVVPPPIVADAA